jgi:GYF domain 2
MAREAAVWFVMIDGEQAGPMSRAEIGLQAASGAITAETFVWKDGMNGWKAGGEVPDLAQLFEPEAAAPKSKPPPPPPAAAMKGKAKAKPAAVAAAPPDKGEGMVTFDTSNFKVSDAVEEDDGSDSHAMEFNTAHFKTNGPPPDESALSLEMAGPVHAAGVAGYPDSKPRAAKSPAPSPRPYAVPEDPDSPGKAAPRAGQGKVLAPPGLVAVTKRAPPEGEEEDKDWAERTSVEALPFGERVHQEEVASSLFDGPVPEVTGAARALDFSSYPGKGAKPAAAPKPAPAAAAPAPAPAAPKPAPAPERRPSSPSPAQSAMPMPTPTKPEGKGKLVVAVVAVAVIAIGGLIFFLA